MEERKKYQFKVRESCPHKKGLSYYISSRNGTAFSDYLWHDLSVRKACSNGLCSYNDGWYKTREEAELFLEKYLMNQKIEQCKADIAKLQENLKKLEEEAKRTVRDGDVWELGQNKYLVLVRGDKIFVSWDFHGSVCYPNDQSGWVYNTLLKEGTFKYNVFGEK